MEAFMADELERLPPASARVRFAAEDPGSGPGRKPLRRCGSSATEVDHIVPIAMGGTHDRANLRGLWSTDHKRATAAIPRKRLERGAVTLGLSNGEDRLATPAEGVSLRSLR